MTQRSLIGIYFRGKRKDSKLFNERSSLESSLEPYSFLYLIVAFSSMSKTVSILSRALGLSTFP